MKLDVTDCTAELSRFDGTAIAALRIVSGNRVLGVSARSRLAIRRRRVDNCWLWRQSASVTSHPACASQNAAGTKRFSLSGLGFGVSEWAGTAFRSRDWRRCHPAPAQGRPCFHEYCFPDPGGPGLILWVIAAALAYPFASFYHEP